MITSFGYLPHIIHPTRITEYTSTIIDNIYSNNLEDEIISGNILIQFVNHLTQFLSINRHINRPPLAHSFAVISLTSKIRFL